MVLLLLPEAMRERERQRERARKEWERKREGGRKREVLYPAEGEREKVGFREWWGSYIKKCLEK